MAEKKEEAMVAFFKKMLEKQGVDIAEYEKEIKESDARLQRLDRRINSALNRRRFYKTVRFGA